MAKGARCTIDRPRTNAKDDATCSVRIFLAFSSCCRGDALRIFAFSVLYHAVNFLRVSRFISNFSRNFCVYIASAVLCAILNGYIDVLFENSDVKNG